MTRIVENGPHVIQIVCYVEEVGPYELTLQFNTENGTVEPYLGMTKLTLTEVVQLILKPLKRLGRVPPTEADPSVFR